MKKTIDAFWLRAPGPGGVSVQDRYVAAVAHVAERFKTNGYVLGYDIINEPLPGTHAPECVSVPPNCSTFDRMLGGFYQRVIAAIRRVDPTHLVWYEPNTLFNWGLATAIPKLDDPRLAMSYHAYCPSPAACDLSVPIQNGERRAEQTGDAIMLTEFGGQHLPEMTSVIAAARPTFTSWLVWAYCGCRDPTGAVPPEAQGFVENPHKSPAGRNVDDRKLRILAEPYPRAVAGTPTRLSFDPKSKVFELSYTVRRADGAGAFQAGACTDIVVPRVHYPKGYNATVAGATRISKRDAGTLRLRATGAATDVTVRIVPATDGRTDMPVVSDDCAPPR
jgi:endoglycosylceramidase